MSVYKLSTYFSPHHTQQSGWLKIIDIYILSEKVDAGSPRPQWGGGGGELFLTLQIKRVCCVSPKGLSASHQVDVLLDLITFIKGLPPNYITFRALHHTTESTYFIVAQLNTMQVFLKWKKMRTWLLQGMVKEKVYCRYEEVNSVNPTCWEEDQS